MRLRLLDNWPRVLTRAWSVRFQLFNAICVGLASGIFALTMDWSWPAIVAFVTACVGLQLAPILARIIWQKDFHDEP